MQFSSLQSFIAMGGYGLYVWLAFFGTWLSIVAVVFAASMRTRKLRQQIVKQQRRDQRLLKRQQAQAADKHGSSKL